MTNKSLEEKAILIKNKKYVLASDRVIYFNENYPNGSIATELLSDPKDEVVWMKSIVTPDVSNPERKFTGYSQARWGDGYINKTSAAENCETSSVSRALAMMGIGVIDSIASVDEIKKAENTDKTLNKLDKFTSWKFNIMKAGLTEDLDAAEEKLNKIDFFTDDQKVALQQSIEQRRLELKNYLD